MNSALALTVPPHFGGGAPFPNLDDWRADAALFATQALRAREASDAAAAVFLDGLASLPADRWERSTLSPQVFALLADEPRRWEWSELAAELERDGAAEPCGEIMLYREPGILFEQLLQRLGRGSRGEDCSRARFLDTEDSQLERYSRALSEASTLIRRVAPGFAEDMAATVHAVALVNSEASFRGSSGVIHRGLIFLSPTDEWTIGVFAEELVHETTHNLLDMLSLREPLLSGDDIYEERYAAPFRPDKRHVYGNFHALVVVSRLLLLFERLREEGVEDPDEWTAKSIDYARRSESALETVSAHDGLSPVARLLIDDLVRPVIENTLAADG